MKKIIVMLLALCMVFSFAACENNPNNETPQISSEDLKLAQGIYKAVVDDINSKLTTGTDDPESAAGGDHDVTYEQYSVAYTFSYVSASDWTLEITVTNESAATVSFSVGSASDELADVTIGETTYRVGVTDIKNGNFIKGVDGSDDPEESTPPDEEEEMTPPDQDEEEQGNPDSGDSSQEGGNDMAPVD